MDVKSRCMCFSKVWQGNLIVGFGVFFFSFFPPLISKKKVNSKLSMYYDNLKKRN